MFTMNLFPCSRGEYVKSLLALLIELAPKRD
jgi:hypothetical protein